MNASIKNTAQYKLKQSKGGKKKKPIRRLENSAKGIKVEGDVGAGESRRPVNVAGERNALRQRRRIASRAAGGGVWRRKQRDGPGKKAK